MDWRTALGLVFLFSGGIAHAHTDQIGDSGSVTVTTLKLDKGHTLVGDLVKDGYSIGGVDFEQGTVDVLTRTGEEGLALKFQGYSVANLKTIDTTIMPDASYKTPEKIQQLLAGYHEQFPAITHLESIGKSLENRDIWAIKISTTPESRDPTKPVILFNGMHHAREVMSPEVPLDTIDYLLTKYGNDAAVTKWVDENDIWVVPMLNVDGNNKVWTGNSMWRKNARGGYGVDINRNYPYAWNSCNGSSSSTFADDYHGPSAGSEPETQALMALVAKIQPTFDISYHSYSELVIYPYGCDGVRSETKEIVESIGHAMAGKIKRDSGSGTYDPGTAWELLYSVDGGDIDWMYHEQNVIPYVIEVSSSSQGFQPAYSWRSKTVERLRPAWSMLLDKLSQSGVRGMVTDGSGRAQPTTMVTVAGTGRGAAPPFTWHVKADGSYHIVLNPGQYTLTFDLNGRTKAENVTVGADRVDLNVEL